MRTNPISFVIGKEKRDVLEKLEYYGIKNVRHLLVSSGREKIRGYTGILSSDEIRELNNEVGIEIMGLYLFHDYPSEIRLSFDAVHALKDEITKNIIDINENQLEEFMKGRDIALSKEEFENLAKKGEKTGLKIIRCNNQLIGSGKLTEEGRIVNYMPKERRLR